MSAPYLCAPFDLALLSNESRSTSGFFFRGFSFFFILLSDFLSHMDTRDPKSLPNPFQDSGLEAPDIHPGAT